MSFKIGDRLIEKGKEPFIIAEAGINHNGDIKKAKEMIVVAKKSGADAVKFQTYHAEEFVQDDKVTYTYESQGKEVTESMLKMFKRCEFSKDEWNDIKLFCDEQGISFLSTPQNVSDLMMLLDIGIDAVKVGSDDFVNTPLIKRYSLEGLPMLLACGMANEKEIDRTVRTIRDNSDCPIVLFLCTSEYPTPPEDVNTNKLITMAERYPDVILGLSDHTQGNEAAIMSVALGAVVFEKHFTLNHDLPGPDHWFSCDPDELNAWASSIRRAYLMKGSGKLEPTEKELDMRLLAHRSIAALCDIEAGETLSRKNICMRRPGTGIPAYRLDDIVGKSVMRSIKAGEHIGQKDLR